MTLLYLMCMNVLPVQFFEQSISRILRGRKDVAGFEGVVSIHMETEPVYSHLSSPKINLYLRKIQSSSI